MDWTTADWIAGTVVLLSSLLIPLAIRRWIVRAPLTDIAGGLVSAGLWLTLFLFFYWAATLVAQQDAFARKPHVGIFIVALISYWILTNDRKTREGVRESREQKVSGEAIEDDSRDKQLNTLSTWNPTTANMVVLGIGVAVGILGSIAYEQFAAKMTYDDCILKMMPAAETREAAILMKMACDNKYNEKVDPFAIVRPLEDETED